MLATIASFWPIITSFVFVAGALIKLYISHHDLKRDVAAMKRQHDADIKAAADARKDDLIRVFTEIDELKTVTSATNTQVLAKLDEMAKDIKTLAVEVAYFRGQQSKPF